MANLVGGAEPSKIMVGGTPVQRVYVGDKYAWPSNPIAKVEWVGSVVATGTTNTFPAHQPGDLLVVVAVESGPASRPGLAAGFTEVHANTVAMSICIGYKFATSSNTPAGTWANASYNTAYVFRNANTSTPFGGIASTSETTAKGVAITMQDTSGDSLLCYGYSNNGTSGGWGATPVGYVAKNSTARMANLQKVDSTSDGALTWSSTAGLVNFRNWTFEILPEDEAPTEEPLWLYDVEQTNKPGRVVDFVLKKGLGPYDPLDEGFLFRCSTISGLDGYVGRTFTKTFPSTAYTKFDCTVEDLYGDGTANPDYLYKKIAFEVRPTAAVADTASMPAGPIKGNADSGLYHMPGDPHYDETIAEATFTTEAEAKAAGYTKYTKRKKK
jgi:hypothetical protein